MKTKLDRILSMLIKKYGYNLVLSSLINIPPEARTYKNTSIHIKPVDLNS
jgi:hypothetical protein